MYRYIRYKRSTLDSSRDSSYRKDTSENRELFSFDYTDMVIVRRRNKDESHTYTVNLYDVCSTYFVLLRSYSLFGSFDICR